MNTQQTISTNIEPVSEMAMQTAIKGIKLIQQGAHTGDWQPFLDLLKDDLTFYAPVPGFAERGLLRGKDEAVKLFTHHTEVTRTDWFIQQVYANGNEICFEARIEGEIADYEYSNQVVMVFVIEDEKIAHFREYAAYMSPEGRGWTKRDTARNAFGYRI
ncbi:MAG: nuclear transport factor 2 family protein [Stenomitos rutilans HA7619-LM2]|nr:nuclear transport factor 2 family protein [Stenomitos rutilans HA7619-LM2]